MYHELRKRGTRTETESGTSANPVQSSAQRDAAHVQHCLGAKVPARNQMRSSRGPSADLQKVMLPPKVDVAPMRSFSRSRHAGRDARACRRPRAPDPQHDADRPCHRLATRLPRQLPPPLAFLRGALLIGTGGTKISLFADKSYSARMHQPALQSE